MQQKQILAIAVLILAACSPDSDTITSTTSAIDSVQKPIVAIQEKPEPVGYKGDFSQINRGGKLFQAHCAECHGQLGQGEPNWRQMRPDGYFPAPPLNGSGHAWHHPKAMLIQTITNGSPAGQGRMPAWGDKLTATEIEDILAWIFSRWPAEVYDIWSQRNQNMSMQM